MKRTRPARKGRLSDADLLEKLWVHKEREMGHPIPYQEIEEATGESANNVQKIRTGNNSNPGIQTMRNVAEFFGVSLAYFDCRTPAEADAYLRGKVRDENASSLKGRVAKLSDEGVQTVSEIVDYMLSLEQPDRRSGKGRRKREPRPPVLLLRPRQGAK